MKNLVCGHVSDGLRDAAVHKVNDLAAPDEIHQRDDYQPYQEAAAADYECVFEADNVAESEYCSAGVQLQHDFSFVCDVLADGGDCGGYRFAPCAESGDDEIVESAHETAEYQCLGIVSSAFAANQDLCCGCGFRERILAVHLLYEVFSERNQEEDAENAAEKGGQEHLHKVHLYT